MRTETPLENITLSWIKCWRYLDECTDDRTDEFYSALQATYPELDLDAAGKIGGIWKGCLFMMMRTVDKDHPLWDEIVDNANGLIMGNGDEYEDAAREFFRSVAN